jgi:DNA-binding CsgD family transcriptional regulator
VLGANRRVEYASRHARQLLQAHSAIQIVRGALVVSDERAEQLLETIPKSDEPRTLELRDRKISAEWLLISRIPTRRRQDPIALLLFAPRAPRRLPQQSLRDVYQLTMAEIQIVEHLVCGHSLTETAALFDISSHTVRTYVKRVRAKCGVRSQADLIRLVLSGPLMPATPLDRSN